MKMILLELKKDKRTGIFPVFLAIGVLGALYAIANFYVRGDTLLSLPIAPMDMLLTQLYGMIMILNMFGVIVAACMSYNMEFKGNAIKKIYMLPANVSLMFLCKFAILFLSLFVAIALQHIALEQIGNTKLPVGTFEVAVLVRFAAYSLVTSLPVLSFMLLVSSRSENMWVSLGVGVAGFLSGMAFATAKSSLILLHPFVIMLRPAVAMSAAPEMRTVIFAICESVIFLAVGIVLSKYKSYE